ncbi:AarF/UbiB family protein [Aeoliella mucimassa]|uniref:ABC1 atypical kinase-like domain-containing protein n=1 Tax=Aeoliella mucimassa TaxID=2527972 RepID=A0A518AQ45_9BACT|nr:AarF/ABC1/UbiB kinase family protein [Aeoliella mucimassa]QDU56838.1 putative protein kinase UbiB [Aeoliella mucimassa]
MFDWGTLIDPAAIASVLPGEYQRFSRPVASALGLFLEHLPEARQRQILAEQLAMSPSATISQRLSVLARACPVLHKLGQVLARDSQLAQELRGELQQLESLPPSVQPDDIERALSEELGPLDRLGITLTPPAIAEASVAVVIGYRQRGIHGDRLGVFKLLKPGIEQRLEEELALASLVGEHLDEKCEEYGIPSLDYRETFEQVRDKLQAEVHLDKEQRNLALAHEYYADDPRVHIPELYENCTSRVTDMEQLQGMKVTDFETDNQHSRRALANLVVEALVAKPVLSADCQSLFHCDPHAGNLMVTDDGRLGVLDWSLVGVLTEQERVSLVQVLLAAATLSSTGVVRALESIATRIDDAPALHEVAQQWIKRVRQGELPGMRWLVGMLDEAYHLAGLRLGADLVLFRKTLHTFDGVLNDLSGEDDRLDEVLFGQFVQQLIAEWPRRWAVMPHCRDFATRLSNFDLTRSLMEIPNTATRYWLGRIRDLLSTLRTPRCPSN